ncbi:MAG: cytochrome c [Arenicellales bacterium]|jgi:cytochrome c556|nr:cytochrome c [Arenicellales bacterium]MDP6289396.1 cytochrome c [Arenicellales bacterium]MDP7155442.1 cytochrome c [Arenicellales bacterium]MDP7284374.1 cytochrome c [Arenicellales bacterium]MDP7482810.1 cytochrome c [Arenicellales bacterium]|tara:strand:+ start:2360 stop:2803 length:444 start_codon:yes stop_codon:yes gene_type:complete
MIKKTTLAALLLIAVSGTSVAAESEDIIKYRQNVMKAVGGHTGAAISLIRGRVDFSIDLEYHVTAIAKALADIPKLFPEDSDFGETRAKEEIWADRGRFEKLAEEAAKAAQDLLAMVKSGDRASIGKGFRDLSESCKSCHKKFKSRN